jgi:hypothetical protein
MPNRTSPLNSMAPRQNSARTPLQLLQPKPMQLFTTVAAMPLGLPFASPMAQPTFSTPQWFQPDSLAKAAPAATPAVSAHPMEGAVQQLQSIARKSVAVEASAKKGCAEREYSIQDLRRMVITVLENRNGGPMKVAEAAGFKKAARSVARYRDEIVNDQTLLRDTAEATLASRIAFVEAMDFKIKGNVDLTSRRIFSADTLDYFARALKRYSDMGWPMDYQAIRLMFSQAAAEMKLVDWKRGDAYVVSRTYVRNFVKSRPELRAYTAGHIDAVRAKKATVQVHARLCHSCARMFALHVISKISAWRRDMSQSICMSPNFEHMFPKIHIS